MVARLEDLAGDNQILLSPATYERVKDGVNVNAWKPRFITGFTEPVPIFELINLKSNSGAPASQLPNSSPEIGRMAANQ